MLNFLVFDLIKGENYYLLGILICLFTSDKFLTFIDILKVELITLGEFDWFESRSASEFYCKLSDVSSNFLN